jgi:hypothetical protein
MDFLDQFYNNLACLKEIYTRNSPTYPTTHITSSTISLFIILSLPILTFGQNSTPINPFAKLKYDSVVAYNYNTDDEYNYDEELIVNKKINKGVGITCTKKLDKEEIKQITDILIDTATYGNGTAACFEPRFALIFFKKAKIVAVIEICLECNRLSSSVEIYAQTRQFYVSIDDKEVAYYDAPKHIREDKNTTIRPYTGFTKDGRKRINDFCKQIKMSYIIGLEAIWDE